MYTDMFGQLILNESDLCDLFLQDPNRSVNHALVETLIKFDDDLNLEKIPKLEQYTKPELSVSEYDKLNQQSWFMPDEYKNFDIAKWVLDKCQNEQELQRAGDELLKFNDRAMFDLLRYLKYLVDTMRKNNVVWGVGRGSSVASFVLFLIGIHKVNSLHYQLSIDEFLK
jgi:DNA polymerase III alpha subunit